MPELKKGCLVFDCSFSQILNVATNLNGFKSSEKARLVTISRSVRCILVAYQKILKIRETQLAIYLISDDSNLLICATRTENSSRSIRVKTKLSFMEKIISFAYLKNTRYIRGTKVIAIRR